MIDLATQRLLKTCQNQARREKWMMFLRLFQYAGGIVVALSLIAMDGLFFGYKVSIDQDLLLILLIVGIATMFWGYYERRMIKVVLAIRDGK